MVEGKSFKTLHICREVCRTAAVGLEFATVAGGPVSGW